MQVEKIGFFKGHSHSIRHCEVSKSGKHLLSTNEDHSLRLWDYETYEPLLIFSGHHDIVVKILVIQLLFRQVVHSLMSTLL